MAATQVSADSPSATAPGALRWKALVALALVQFMIVIDNTVVNVALPSIQTSLQMSPSGLAWVVNGYIVMAGGLLLLGGRAGDLFGRRRLFLMGTALFGVASLTSGLALNSTMLILSRFVGETISFVMIQSAKKPAPA